MTVRDATLLRMRGEGVLGKVADPKRGKPKEGSTQVHRGLLGKVRQTSEHRYADNDATREWKPDEDSR